MPGDPTATERAVVVQLLGRARPTTPAVLYAAIRNGTTTDDIDSAVSGLKKAGVIHLNSRGSLSVTTAVRRLDAIGLVSL